VWRFAKRFAVDLAGLRADVVTAEYKVAARPDGRGARRLQPERLGPHPGVGVFAARRDAGDRLGAARLGRARRGRDHRRPSTCATCRRASPRSATCGARCSAPAGRFDLAPLLQSLR
jgi:hypothetical protein